jgi:hypothetical protein
MNTDDFQWFGAKTFTFKWDYPTLTDALEAMDDESLVVLEAEHDPKSHGEFGFSGEPLEPGGPVVYIHCTGYELFQVLPSVLERRRERRAESAHQLGIDPLDLEPDPEVILFSDEA